MEIPKPPYFSVVCPELGCHREGKPIPLRASTPQRKDLDQDEWPNDGNPLYVACPECRHVSVHRRVGLACMERESRAWLCIAFRCGLEGCNTPAEFHVLIEPTATKPDVLSKLRNEYWTAVLPCSHPISIADDQAVAFDWDTERMRGYDPNADHWKRI